MSTTRLPLQILPQLSSTQRCLLRKPLHRRHASTRKPQTDKSRILSKPTRFNPPSHGSRRVRPRTYPGPDLSATQRAEQATRRYPNMFPPEGSWGFWFLTQKSLHVWITLSTLVSLAIYSISRSFLSTTVYRSELPTRSDFTSHPFQSLGQLLHVYKLHVAYESEQVAQKRRQKIEDADKRKEFMRAHGIEPGFLTGSWMEKFGTVEGDRVREGLAVAEEQEAGAGVAGGTGVSVEERGKGDAVSVGDVGVRLDQDGDQIQTQERIERRKPKRWLGIW